MKLVVGLGNPGIEYTYNRHNIGFMVLDKYAEKLKTDFKLKEDYFFLQTKKAILIKPTTYMNLSGKAVRKILSKYSEIEDFIVIVDDIYLPLAEIRLKQKGGDGGHNGLKSIIDELGHSEFNRMRIGVDNNPEQILSDYVLSDFNESDLKKLEICFNFTQKIISTFIRDDMSKALNMYSRSKKSYSEQLTPSSESRDQRRNNE
ncbi:MAG: aminoacyl-tRNA hydrolase [Candidatus Cloacimonetes bacterium]|nr:aminoacyl-tRNA hydrolase [Candidatus Cloacimonadota bacterium]